MWVDCDMLLFGRSNHYLLCVVLARLITPYPPLSFCIGT